MKQKFYICKHCGNVIEKVEEVYAYCNLHGLWKK